jgi:hypothetical protein
MRAKNTRPSRPKRTASRARREPAPIPTLQMTVNARQTDWTCPSCFARGSVEHPADAATVAILELVRAHHSIKQPGCSVS